MIHGGADLFDPPGSSEKQHQFPASHRKLVLGDVGPLPAR
jgi:hypothetical protein